MNFLKLYMYLPVLALLVGTALVFMSSDVYRYECQDPTHWLDAKCQPPICEADGTCTKDLIYKADEVLADESIIEETFKEEPVDTSAEAEAIVSDVLPETQENTNE